MRVLAVGLSLVFLLVNFVETNLAADEWLLRSSTTGDLPVPNNGDQQTCSIIADLDGDGINDIVIGERTKAPSIVWYKYRGGKWDQYLIDDSWLRPEAGGEAFDIDKDGDLDIVLGQDSSGNQVWWWENPDPDFDGPWKRRLIKNDGARKHHDQSFADYDGDGRVELVSWNQKGKQLLLFEIPVKVKSSESWPYRTIFAWLDGKELEGFPSTPTDIDLDGNVDIVGGGRWFKHLGDTRFKANTIDDEMRFTQCSVGQLVKGGRPEIVLSPGDMDGVAKWYEWSGSSWITHDLREVMHGHTCEVADVNGDGNQDIFIAEMGNPGAGDQAKMYIWYGDGTGELEETVVSEGQGNHEGKLADLDGDGDLDILVKPYNHNSPRLDVLLNTRQD